jgi:hypothetical protein
MKSILSLFGLLVLSLGALVLLWPAPAGAAELGWAPAPYQTGWRCQNKKGCWAQLPREGKLINVWFARGTRIEESEGWIIDPSKGWKKVD